MAKYESRNELLVQQHMEKKKCLKIKKIMRHHKYD